MERSPLELWRPAAASGLQFRQLRVRVCHLIDGSVANSRNSLSHGGFSIQVGNSTDAQTVVIPQTVLDHSRVLLGLLQPYCRIINADASIFSIIIEYLHSCITLGIMDFSTSGQLRELTIHEHSLLNFAKAWHVGDMLRMPGLKNRLIQVFRAFYMRCLQTQRRPTMRPEAFIYIRRHLGKGSKAERFIVDFLAGLMQRDPNLKRNDFRLLHRSVQVAIRDRWIELTGRGLKGRRDSAQHNLDNDRIISGATSYQDTPGEVARHADFRIQYSYNRLYTSFGLSPPLSGIRAVAARTIALDIPVVHTEPRNQDSRGRGHSPVRRHDFADASRSGVLRTYQMPPLPSLEASAMLPLLESATLQHARDGPSSPCPSLSGDDTDDDIYDDVLSPPCEQLQSP